MRPWPRSHWLDLVRPGGGAGQLLPGGVGGGVVGRGRGEQGGRGKVLGRIIVVIRIMRSYCVSSHNIFHLIII